MNVVEPCTLVLFGASGNLSRVKLIPSLFRLDQANRLSPQMKIVSVGRGELSQESWLAELKNMLDAKFKHGYDQAVLHRFMERQYYHANPPADTESFRKLANLLANSSIFPQNVAYFLSVRPSDFSSVVESLSQVGLLQENPHWKRVLIEKPFGTDLVSAQKLQTELTRHLQESQIYRIDHYLGKSALQNILLLRFTNRLFDPLWNRQHIDHVQITNNETLGVGERTTFYDATGALRDMMQSHLLQTLALVAMDQPATLSPQAVRAEKIRLLESIRPIPLQNTFRAQYTNGQIETSDGRTERVSGYLQELASAGITQSTTETYAAIKLFIDNERWRGVPFYLRTAKRMSTNNTMVSIRLKPSGLQLPATSPSQHPNWIIFSIQPQECVCIELESKIPGLDTVTRTLNVNIPQRMAGDETIDSYETLLLDLIAGDASRYLHINEVEAQWRLIDPIVQAWAHDKSAIHQYPAGSRDPLESRVIFESPDQFWRHSLELGGDTT